MPVYLDYNASAPLYPAVKAGVIEALDALGNPSSVHGYGRTCKALLNEARQTCADFFGVRLDKVVFTSGATEANVQVIETFKQKNATIYASMIEHESVRAPLTHYVNLHQIGVLQSGAMDVAELEAALQKANPDAPILICCMFVNNETGVIQPIPEIVALSKRYNAYVLCDAVQALGRVSFDFAALGVDYLTFSAHKLGGLKGAGALIISDRAVLEPLVRGGGQERGLRSGTENLLGIIALGLALKEVVPSLADQSRLLALRQNLEKNLEKALPSIIIAGADASRVAGTSCFILPGVLAETQVMRLDLEGFAVSAGSACSSGKLKASHVIANMGYDANHALSSLRVSFGVQTTAADLEAFVETYVRVMRHLLTSEEK